jgi:hypothetical protein
MYYYENSSDAPGVLMRKKTILMMVKRMIGSLRRDDGCFVCGLDRSMILRI